MTAPHNGGDRSRDPSPRRRVGYRRPEPLPREFFESEQARAAMGARDVAEVFAVLARMGVSQRRIAALTGQSQSEISEIRAGRKVRAVEVIERIADGLSTPRGWWGLAHTQDAFIPPKPEPEEVTLPALPAAPAALTSRPSPSTARVPPIDLVAARHLIGLIGALRASLTPRPATARPSRAATLRALPTTRLRRRPARR